MVDATGTTAYAYDELYRLTSVTFPGPRTVSYGYDAASRRTSITYPGGSNQATYTYDAANRLTAVTGWDSNVIQYAYDDANRMTSATLPSSTGIVSSYTYDDADRLTGISHVKDGTTTVASVAYTLDDVGNRTQRVDQQGTHTYAYDDLYRLTSVTYPGPSTTSYAFDAFGNRTSMTTSAGTTTYTHDDADRITQVQPPSPASAIAYDWDDNGNLVERGADTFVWDYEDRMVEATVNSVTTTFAYRGDGLRDSRTVGMTTTTFTWDINAGLPVVLDDGNQYLYGAGLSAMKQSGDWSYYLAGGLGSTMVVVDANGDVENGYTYDAYGEPTVTGSLANEFDFAGQQTDASTGLQYLRARYYDPATGTLLSREPLAVRPGWMGNPFGYAGANPARFVDPTGNRPVDSDGCEEGNEACYRRVQAESEAACAGLYFYTYTYCKDRVPFRDWMLIGEYTLNGLIDVAGRIGNGFELAAEAELIRAELYENLGPQIRACAANEACSLAVAAALHMLGVALAPTGLGEAIQVVAFGWDTYSASVQWEEMQKPVSQMASP